MFILLSGAFRKTFRWWVHDVIDWLDWADIPAKIQKPTDSSFFFFSGILTTTCSTLSWLSLTSKWLVFVIVHSWSLLLSLFILFFLRLYSREASTARLDLSFMYFYFLLLILQTLPCVREIATFRNLQHNLIPAVSTGWVYGLRSLRQLYLSRNNITRIDANAWSFCPHLFELWVQSPL